MRLSLRAGGRLLAARLRLVRRAVLAAGCLVGVAARPDVLALHSGRAVQVLARLLLASVRSRHHLSSFFGASSLSFLGVPLGRAMPVGQPGTSPRMPPVPSGPHSTRMSSAGLGTSFSVGWEGGCSSGSR